MKLSETLYAQVQDIWPRYLSHPFVTEMACGTLPKEKFRYYMLQDYLYLQDYVKIFAAMIQKAEDFEQIRFLCGEMSATIDETFRTHLPYMKRLGIGEQEIACATAHIDSSAYSHYMICEAQAGDVLTGLVALLNCSWSYAYIAEKTVEAYPEAVNDESYGSWFAGYVSPEYKKTNQALIDRIDALAENIDEKKLVTCARSSKSAVFLIFASGTWCTPWASAELLPCTNYAKFPRPSCGRGNFYGARQIGKIHKEAARLGGFQSCVFSYYAFGCQMIMPRFLLRS